MMHEPHPARRTELDSWVKLRPLVLLLVLRGGLKDMAPRPLLLSGPGAVALMAVVASNMMGARPIRAMAAVVAAPEGLDPDTDLDTYCASFVPATDPTDCE